MKYFANFLWPCKEGSVEEAGYEFANAGTEEYREEWWHELLRRATQQGNEAESGDGSLECCCEKHVGARNRCLQCPTHGFDPS